MKFKPHDYQARALQWIYDNEKCGLLLPMGAGKTVTTLTAIQKLLYEHFDVSNVLIIGPVRVIESTWPNEISKWEHLKHMSYSVVSGTPKKRMEAIDKDADIHLIGKENVQWLIENYMYDWKWDMVIIDELSCFKNPQAKRFKALRKVMPMTKRFIGLTGTPAPRGLPDIWAQVYLMDMGERLGRTLTTFRNRYLTPGRRNGYIVYEWVLQEGAQERIYQKIGDICMSINQEESAKLPPVKYLNYEVNLGSSLLSEYKAFKRDKVLDLTEDEQIVGSNAGVICGMLAQFTSGAIYTENKSYNVLHRKKLEALDDLIESANGNPVMVFYYFQHEKERLLERYKDYKIKCLETANDVNAWNNQEIEILLLHPASAGHGLNLQDGGNIAIWYSLPNWNLEYYQQANARIYRQGQKQSVTIYHLIAKETIDEDQMASLDKKDVNQQALIDALRR